MRAPHRVSHLCLVSSVAFDEWPSREVKLARATIPLVRHLPPSWLTTVLAADLARGYVDEATGHRSIERYIKPFASPAGRDILMAHFEALDPADTLELGGQLARVVCPTAIVHGAHDPFLPLSGARRLQQAIAGASLDILESGRHFLPEESPERLADLLATLLDR